MEDIRELERRNPAAFKKIELLWNMNLDNYFKKQENHLFAPVPAEGFCVTEVTETNFWTTLSGQLRGGYETDRYFNNKVVGIRSKLSWILHHLRHPDSHMRAVWYIWQVHCVLSSAGTTLKQAFLNMRFEALTMPLVLASPTKNCRIKKLKEKMCEWIKEIFEQADSEESLLLAVARAGFVIPNFLRLVAMVRQTLDGFVRARALQTKGIQMPKDTDCSQLVAVFNRLYEDLKKNRSLMTMMGIKPPLGPWALTVDASRFDREGFDSLVRACHYSVNHMEIAMAKETTMDEFVNNDCGDHVEMLGLDYDGNIPKNDVGYWLDYFITRLNRDLKYFKFPVIEREDNLDEYAPGEGVPSFDDAVDTALVRLGYGAGNAS